MARQIKDGFLKEYLRYVQETEVPDYFGLWCGVSLISSCLERKCKVDYSPTIYPNMYIILVAGSALCRKSTAISQASNLLYQLNNCPNIFAQKATPEGLIDAFKAVEVSATDSEIITNTKAQGILIASELSTLIDKNAFSSGLIALLTDLWDSSDNSFRYRTRGRGEEVISDSCISLLGATTSDWLRESLPIQAVGGGFTSRVIFVTSERSSRLIAWPRKTQEMIDMERRMVHDLNEIRELHGEFHPTAEAQDYFEHIYKTFIMTTGFTASKGLKGYAGRRHVILMKVAMCCSAARNGDMTLIPEDFTEADSLLRNTELTMPDIIRNLESSAEGEDFEFVLRIIEQANKINRSMLMRRVSHRLKSTQLDEVLETLRLGDQVKVVDIENRIHYQYVKG